MESDKDKLTISYMELINLMQQHSLGLDWKVCRNSPENPGGQQVWVSSAPFWLVPYQSALGDCNQKVEGSDFSHWFCTCVLHLEQCLHVGLPNARRWHQPVGNMWHSLFNLLKLLKSKFYSVKRLKIYCLHNIWNRNSFIFYLFDTSGT